jgi:hypothetical protein
MVAGFKGVKYSLKLTKMFQSTCVQKSKRAEIWALFL